MYLVHGDKCFTKPTTHVLCKKMLGGRNLRKILSCNHSFISGLDSSQHHFSHRAFRRLSDRTLV